MTQLATFVDVWPLVIIEAPEQSTVESIEFFCERQGELFKRRERFATVHDMTRMKSILDARARKVMGDWTKEHEHEIKRWHVASASVCDSALIRGVITAVHWFVKPPSPQLVTASMRTGVDFVIDRLRDEGIPIPTKLTDYQRSVA